MRLALAAATLLVFILVLSSAHPTLAAQVNHLSVGDRVRITAPTIDSKPMVGRIVSADPQQFTLALADGKADSSQVTRGIAWESLSSLERSEGQHSKARRGMATGAFVGLFGTLGALAFSDLDSNDLGGGAALGGAILFTAAGALVGGFIGSTMTGESWTPLPLDSRVSLGLGAPSTPFAVGFRATF